MKYTNLNGELLVGKLIKHIVIVLVVVVALFGSFGIIGAGEIGVKTRLGKVVGTYQPGVYMKLPFIEQVHKINIKVKTVDYDKNGVEGDGLDTSALSASSKDLQQVWANIENMKYKITVIKYDKNPDYEAEMAKWKESQERNWGYRNEPMREEPSLQRAERSLEVFLTEEEYTAIKKAVLEQFN